MKIVLIIYAVSWLILSAVYIKNFIRKNGRNKGPWYFHILTFVLAPLILFIVLFSLYEPFRHIKIIRKLIGIEAFISPHEVESIHYLEVKRNEALAEFQTIEKQDYSIIECVEIGKRLHAIVKEYKFDSIFPSLDKVNISKEVEFVVHDCRSDRRNGFMLLIKLPKEEKEEDENIYNYLTVEQSCSGAWQIYLLHTIRHYMPIEGYAEYPRFEYIFDKEDLKQIDQDKKESIDLELLSQIDVRPIVIQKGNKFFMSSCYWSGFDGLVREFFRITIENNKVVDMFKFDQRTEYEYDIGLVYGVKHEDPF